MFLIKNDILGFWIGFLGLTKNPTLGFWVGFFEKSGLGFWVDQPFDVQTKFFPLGKPMLLSNPTPRETRTHWLLSIK